MTTPHTPYDVASSLNAPDDLELSLFAAHWKCLRPRPGMAPQPVAPVPNTSNASHPVLFPAALTPHSSSYMLLAALTAAGDWTPLASLCEQLSLSRPTVTKLLRNLEQRNLVESSVAQRSSAEGGRPPLLYRRPPETACIIALRAARHHVEGLLLDACGQGLAHHSFPLASPDDIIDTLISAYATLRACTQARVITVSIAVMGIVRPDGSIESGHFPRLNTPQWREDFSTHLPAGTPLLVANDAKLAARWMEAQASYENIVLNSFIAVECSHDLGCALVLGGTVWEGEHGAAGEVALMRSSQWAKSLDLLHHWDNRINISQAYRSVGGIPRVKTLPSISSIAAPCPTLQPPSPEEYQFIDALSSALGQALTPLVLLLDPAAVVIGGEAAWAGEVFRRRLNDILLSTTPSPPKVYLSTGKEHCVINGAAHLALRYGDQHLLADQ